MKRRIFLRNGALGAVSLGLPTPDWAASPIRPTHVYLEMLRLTSMLGLRSGRAPEAARAAMAGLEQCFAQRGYETCRATVWYYPGIADHFFFPLELRRRSAGLLDPALLAFARQPDDSWRHVATLNGYQLEALSQAVAALSSRDESLRDLLLPVANGPGAAYSTRLGSVSTTTRLCDGGATIDVTIRRGEAVIFEQRFASQHCLTTRTRV